MLHVNQMAGLAAAPLQHAAAPNMHLFRPAPAVPATPAACLARTPRRCPLQVMHPAAAQGDDVGRSWGERQLPQPSMLLHTLAATVAAYRAPLHIRRTPVSRCGQMRQGPQAGLLPYKSISVLHAWCRQHRKIASRSACSPTVQLPAAGLHARMPPVHHQRT